MSFCYDKSGNLSYKLKAKGRQFQMKKKVCLAMSLLMLAGTVPAQAETIGEAEQITFTAKVGTKELYRNQSRISLDAAIYIKDGYAMRRCVPF